MAASMPGDFPVFRTSRSAGSKGSGSACKAGNLYYRVVLQAWLLALTFIAALPSCLAGGLRVTTWNLEFSPNAGTDEARMEKAAAALKEINPDVILLQQVRDWKMCQQLAEALSPAKYTLHVCSCFRDERTGTLSQQQVAILSTAKAYFSWSEAWRPQRGVTLNGGFAFAALQFGQQRFGVFSVHGGAISEEERNSGPLAPDVNPQAAIVAQLLEQVGSVTNWLVNRVDAFVVGATLDTRGTHWTAARDQTLRLLEAADFGDAFREGLTSQPVTAPGEAGQPGATVDYILTQPVGCAANPRTVATPFSQHYPVTCDVDLDPVKVAVAHAVRAEAMRARQIASVAPAQPPPASPQPFTINYPLFLLAAALGGVVALGFSVLILSRRKPLPAPSTPALLGEGADFPTSYTVVAGTRSATEAALATVYAPPAPQSVITFEAPDGTHTEAEVLRQRALAAEQRAQRAQAVVRKGLLRYLGPWLKQRLVRKLVTDRAQLLQAQQAATHKVRRVEERLARIEQQMQRQSDVYQARIEVLTLELLNAKEENRELIRARIAQVKAEMETAHARLMAQSEGAG
jgi:endonuclease/exonuclease/phosphatase family metal-dependent hydrolase